MIDLSPIAGRIEAHLGQATGGPAVVEGLRPLPGGACQDNLRVDVRFEAGPERGLRRVVLRSDAASSLPGSIDRRAEHDVIGRAVEAGVTTPRSRWLGRGLVREEAWAHFLDWLDGEAIGRRVVASPELAAARAGLAAEVATELAKIHSVTPRAGEGPTEAPAAVAVRTARHSLDSLQEPRPALEWALRWLAERIPDDPEVSLVHGDFRTGNLMVTPEGLSGVLDWEFAHWGSPYEDLAWICVRDWRFGALALPVGGFARRAELNAAYEAASGRILRPADAHWWEVMGNVRWAAGSLHQGERYLSGESRDIELIAVARRAAEMEFEALRLIGQGEEQG